jgi:hypothetical protein
MHRTADGFEIHEGDTFWDNNLDLVTVTKVAAYPETNHNKSHPAFGQVTWWHDTTKGMTDGSRLAKYHPRTGKDAAEA